MSAARSQLLRQLLIESVLLSLAGGVLGLFLSVWTIQGLLSLLPSDGVTRTLKAIPDVRILAFNFVLATATGIFL